jgi:hypothetical protein
MNYRSIIADGLGFGVVTELKASFSLEELNTS